MDGLWKRPESDPLIIQTHTEGDYWIRHVSLSHTDCRDGSDVALPERTRMYHLTGAPHMGRPLHDQNWIGQLTPSDMSAAPYMRATLVLLDRWATDGTPPPPSRLPLVSQGTLIEARDALAAYPKLPGVNLPKGPSRLPRYEYGPDFDHRGIETVFPPRPIEGQEYPIRVPRTDTDGNGVAGLRYPDVDVSLGTYNGWSLRKAATPRAISSGILAASCPSPARGRSANEPATRARRSRSATRATRHTSTRSPRVD